MQKLLLRSLASLLLCGVALKAASLPDSSDSVATAAGVLQRLLGDRAADFHLAVIPDNTGLDVYEVSAHEGRVEVAGNSAVSIAHGAYEYLFEACHCQVGWEGRHLDLPATFPDRAKQRVVSPYPFRQEYNVCTLGYTAAYWGWDRWQQELDWMALHGINMALAPVGTEAIWQRVWLSMGLTQAELDQFFTGPAFLPWHRMGNINRWEGPPPASFFPKQVALQKKIIARMRALGIHPIGPAFAGFVPPSLHRVHPETTITKLASWAGFTPAYGSYLLDPVSPLYPEIGRRYIREWEKEFGRNKYFLADSFNELKVPVPPDRPGRLAQLARYGDAVYRSIVAGDPDAVWIMQGWLFYNDTAFWDKGSAAALLSKVPDDRMIILDLACDFRPIWSSQDAFYGKQWIYSVIHNFGGKSSLGGDLPFFAADGAKTLASPQHGHLVGYGMAPEGIENNEIVYELLTNAMWSRQAIDLPAWIHTYCLSRYGGCPPEMTQAWDLLCQSCYHRDVHYVRPHYQYLPLTEPRHAYKTPDDSPAFLAAVRHFLACAPELGANPLYRADAIELTVQYLGSRVDALLAAAVAAHTRGDAVEQTRAGAAALGLLSGMDRLLASHPINRLHRWTDFARAWGDTPAEAAYYEADAKWLVTIWGGELTEYSSRVWNGLVGPYYRARWERLFREWQTGKPADLLAWEEKWIGTPSGPAPAPSTEDVLAACRRLLARGEKEQQRLANGKVHVAAAR